MAVRSRGGVVAAVLSVAAALAPSVALAQTPPAVGTVVSPDGTTINARASPGGRAVAKVKHGARLRIACQLSGPVASGSGGASAIWDRVLVGSQRLYVADALMRTGGDGVLVAKLCGAPALPPSPTPGVTAGACGIVSPVTQIPPFRSRAAFISAAVPGARRSNRETGVPASVTLAQAILETGSGTVAAGANNYFGIKATAVAGPPAGVYQWGVDGVGCVLRKTQEVIGRRPVTTIGAFRAYATLEASIRDHGARLLSNPVYQGAFRYTDKPEKFARVIARYYATDPAYGNKVVGLMRSERLTRYDVKATASGTPDAPPAPGPAPPVSPAPTAPTGGGVSPP